MDKHNENHASEKGVVEITRYMTAGKTVKIIRIIKTEGKTFFTHYNTTASQMEALEKKGCSKC